MESQGIKLARRAVANYMKELGLKSNLSCKYRPTVGYSHKEPVAENILNRDFTAKYPGIKCVSDITYLPTTHEAVRNRNLQGNVLFHSDRGVQYACRATVNCLKSCNFTQSMSRKGIAGIMQRLKASSKHSNQN